MSSVMTHRRQVILHYHLFKNAGTSVEKVLSDSFGRRWQSFDQSDAGARISAAEMQAFIEQHPELRAVSSHQVVPPLPTGNLDILPIVFLRDPLLRVRSCYLFEWQKQLRLDTPRGSLTEYIEEKFKQEHSSVIANFQVCRLSNTGYDNAQQPQNRYLTTELTRAMAFIAGLPFVGLVERFGESLDMLDACARDRFPGLVVRHHHENVTQSEPSKSHDQRLEELLADIGTELFDELCLRNRLDLQLYSYALGRFDVVASEFSARQPRVIERCA